MALLPPLLAHGPVGALGGDGRRALLGTGTAALRHLGVSIPRHGAGGRCRCSGCGRRAQTGEQQCAPRGGDGGVPGRARPGHGAVGQLLVFPGRRSFDQVVQAARAFEVGVKSIIYPLRSSCCPNPFAPSSFRIKRIDRSLSGGRPMWPGGTAADSYASPRWSGSSVLPSSPRRRAFGGRPKKC